MFNVSRQLFVFKKNIFIITNIFKMAENKTGDRTWGTSSWDLAATEVYGRPSSGLDDFIELSNKDLNDDKYKNAMQAAHCMIYARNNEKVFATYSARATVLMQMRFDGYIGFPGGLVDKGETILNALNRELHEEMDLDQSYNVKESDHISTHWSISKQICLHFYSLEINNHSDLKQIEKNALNSHDYGTEVLGSVRVPLYTMGDGFRGFPCFLTHAFIGNAKQQLIKGLTKLNIMTTEEINLALNAKPVPVKVYVPPVKKIKTDSSTNPS